MDYLDLLGFKVKDKITDYEGIATSKHFYLTGCTQYGVLGKIDKDGTIPEIMYFDEGRLFVIGEGFKPEELKGMDNGCDHRERP